MYGLNKPSFEDPEPCQRKIPFPQAIFLLHTPHQMTLEGPYYLLATVLSEREKDQKKTIRASSKLSSICFFFFFFPLKKAVSLTSNQDSINVPIDIDWMIVFKLSYCRQNSRVTLQLISKFWGKLTFS